MNDDDDFEGKPTPSRKPGNTPKQWRMSDSERERHRRSWVRGVPVVMPDPTDEVTAPMELLLNGQLDTDDYAQIEALRRSADDVYVLLMNVAKAISRHRDSDRSGSRDVEAKVIAAVDETARQISELGGRLDALPMARVARDLDVVRHEIGERHTKTEGSIHQNLGELLGTHRRAGRIATIALGLALGAVGYVAAMLRSSGADEVRLQQLLHDNEQHAQDLRDIRREMRRKDQP